MADTLVAYPPQDVDAAITARMTSTPATGVADNSAGGSGILIPRNDHVHASKVRKGSLPITANGLYTWTYNQPFGAGVVPRVSAMAVCPNGTTAIINVQGEGDPTNTQAVFRIAAFQQSVVALIGLTVLSVNNPPANVKLDVLAFEP